MMRRILNLGAGTQSSVLAIMCDRGELPAVEVAIFADTQAEPREVYDHLEWLKRQLKNTNVVTVTAGSLTDAALHGRVSKKTGKIWAKGIPYWLHDDGKLGKIRKRQCTVDFKIVPINRWIKKTLARPLPQTPVITRVFGISHDEMGRMRISTDPWAVNEYPLVEMRLNRAKVIAKAQQWFPGHEFPRSACVYCPFHNNEEWRRIRASPEDWKAAVDFDEAARALHSQPGSAMESLVYIHRDGVPLKTADLSPSAPTETLWGMENECEGMCGV